MQVYCFPERIIAWIERPAFLIELIREDENQLFTGNITFLLVCLLRSILVDETEIVGKDWDLASGINPAKVEPAIQGWLLLQEMG